MTTNDANPTTDITTAEDDMVLTDAADDPPLDEEPPLDDDDETPQDGDILEPGAHFVELATAIPCRRDVVLDGMTRIGFKALRPDESRARSDAAFAVREHRFVGDLTRTLKLHQTDAVRWSYVRRIRMDLTRDVKDYRLSLIPYQLETGVLYEALFMSRMRSQPNRLAVEDHLKEMGFIPICLTALRRDARIRGREGTSVTVWFGLLEWDTVASPVTEEDPFYFEDLVAV